MTDCLRIFDEWFTKRHSYYWGEEPDRVRARLVANNDGSDMIAYNIAADILRDAETTKMHGRANAGMTWMKEQWLKSRIAN